MNKEFCMFTKVWDAYCEQSIQKGFNNQSVIRRTDRIVHGLINAGILPHDCYLGRMNWFGSPYLKRVAINVEFAFLADKKDDIMEWVFERGIEDHPEDVFNALVLGSFIAGSHGYWKMAAPILQRFTNVMAVMPDTSTRTKILRDPSTIIRLSSAK